MSRALRIAVVIGTRPEAIKLAPILLAARRSPSRFEVRVIRTGQHRELVDRVMREFGLEADVHLDLMRPSQGLSYLLGAAVSGLAEVFARDRPDWVLVQGDTTTTLAGALAAFHERIRVGHVEAGLRTGNRQSPFPEETNRTLVARLADLHFAPTDGARRHLMDEGIDAASIVVTGNTVVDALHHALACPPSASAVAAHRPATTVHVAHRPTARYVLVTTHRRENRGAALDAICDAVLALTTRDDGLVAWLPMHPSPVVRAPLVARLGGHPRVHLTEPLDYIPFVQALHGAALVLTDSGGVQEECATLGKPVLVLRATTERPEAIDAGVAVLVGCDAALIVATASRLLDDPQARRAMERPSDAFGHGGASEQILEALARASATPPG